MKLEELARTANEVRADVIRSLLQAGSGHAAGPMGMADVFTALYFEVAKLDPQNPTWPERDYIVLSNGHICPLLYAVMARRGYFPLDELLTLRKLGSRLQGHPHREALPGLENCSGPLGSGLSQAAGMAYGLRMDNKSNRIWCLGSDGELQEGNVWEALLFAGKYRLNHLCYIIDRNNIQIDGFTEDVMPLEPLRAKFEAFNWHVLEMNGHNFGDILKTLNEVKTIAEKPTCVIAHTIPGENVDFMEGRYEWHGKAPNREEAALALKQLRSLNDKIDCADHC